MAWVLVRLKGRLLVNGLRTSAIRAIGFVLGCIYALGAGMLGFALLAGLRDERSTLAVVVELGAVSLVAAWAAVPLLGFGSDETLDPIRLALLPIPRRPLMAGLLAASLIGPAAAATAIGLAGAVVALAPAGPGVVIVAVGAALELALCVATSRAVVTALSAALRSRKGRDLRIILVAVVGLLPQIIRLAFLQNVHVGDTSALRPWADALSWIPVALPARAMVAAGSAHWVAATLELAGGALTLVLLLAWWSRSIEGVMTTAESAPGGDAKAAEPLHARAGQVPLPLFDPGLDALPRTRAGAVAARELRYTWRDPRRRVQLVSGFLIPFVLLAGVLSRNGLDHPQVVFVALLVAFFASGNRAVNQIGFDGAAFWAHEAAGQDLRSDLNGKNFAIAATTLPLAIVVALGLAIASGGWIELGMTVWLVFGVIGLLLGVGNIASVLLPIPLPDSSANLWGSQQGQGCTNGLLSLAVLAIEGVLGAPLAIGVLVAHGGPARALVVVLGVAYGLAVRELGLAVAVRIGRRRGPEILEALSPRQAG